MEFSLSGLLLEPQCNGVSERRNRTLLDMVRFMMSFIELPLSFWAYALETAAKLLNMTPSKTVAQMPYQIWHGKPASYKRLVGDKLDSWSSLCRFMGYPKETMGYYFYDPSKQKGFCLPKCSVLEKRFSTYTQLEELLLEESSRATPQMDVLTSSVPIVPTKDIHVLRRSTGLSQQLERAAWYDHEIWQIDVIMAFLNGFVEEDIYMDQPEGFTSVREEQKICHLQGFIYGLKQAFQSWNIHFDEGIRVYNFIKNDFDPCVYKKVSGSSVAFLVLYMDNILLIGNDVKMLGDTNAWLSTQFSMKDLGSIQYVVQCRRPNVFFALSVTRIYQVCADEAHWTAIKTILKYLRRIKDMFLIYGGGELILKGYNDASFQSNEDDAKSESGFVFRLNGGVVA
ncbi:UNVERIFIED_CONTAM: Retrovirus-related Pol polyprotein from transposon TNT 1-94 [Sesamum indicum]